MILSPKSLGQRNQLLEKIRPLYGGHLPKGDMIYSLKGLVLWDILVCHNPNAFIEINSTHTTITLSATSEHSCLNSQQRKRNSFYIFWEISMFVFLAKR